MRVALATAFLLVAQTAPPGVFYDFEWRSAAMLSRWQAGDTVTDRAALSGKSRLRLTPIGKDRWHFAFWGPEGVGEGDIIDGQLQDVTFPVALDVGTPAAPPHLTSGTFRPDGDPRRPSAFELEWAEGFICRTRPATCGNVTAWSRELTGRATRTTP
jgi:hypothetical protein